METTIIFPHQLFKEHPGIHASRTIYLVEEALFFRQYNFHKQKLVLHRASMKMYSEYLTGQGFKVNYVETHEAESDIRQLIPMLAKNGTTSIHYAEATDNWLEKRMHQCCTAFKINCVQYPTPNFLNTLENVADYFEDKKTYFQTDFYIDQRKKRNILLEDKNKPIGGRWSFDADNRLKFPKKEIAPLIKMPDENDFVKEARLYVEKHFTNNYGTTASPFENGTGFYPTTFTEAENWLNDFLENRLGKFGIYEDAMVAKENFLYHSVLTPALNIGLLHPQQIIDKTMDAAITYDVPLNSLEGFVRQIIGWREFIRIVYEREGSKQRTTNYWKFTRKIPACFWTAETGILPVDTVIKKVLKSGYCHHIERLMVLGNFMVLCEFDPDDVYKWFMEMYIDSYDWVMVPNVYGMTQFADGGLMVTKPYISASNYLVKMSDFAKGDWQQTWDGLFWRFMHVHRDFFLKNPRLGMLVNTFDKMEPLKRNTHLQNAEIFLKSLDEKNNRQQK